MNVRFEHPAVVRRPPKSRRFDVYGLKIARALTLFNRGPVDAWLDLESTPSVSWYCERPLVIEENNSKRVVDFYAVRNGVEELLFYPTKAERDAPQSLQDRWPGFANWCVHHRIKAEFLIPTTDQDDSAARANWGQIVRELSAFRRYVSNNLVSAIGSELREPRSINDLHGMFPTTDPILIKVALFQLLHQGLVTSANLNLSPFSSDTTFVMT